jgi:hypothetical protein
LAIGPEPIGVVVGGFKINAMENTSTLAIGDVFLQNMDSQVKTNLINGQTYGDFVHNYMQPISSPIYDPDGADTSMPMIMSARGLED